MIICLLGFDLNISRLFTFVCFLCVLLLVQSNLILTVHAAPGVIKIVPTSSSSSSNETLIFPPANRFASNHTSNATSTSTCVAEVLDETLPYFSLPYRIFAGALIVPITFCAISGNILVIYVIKHYHALRITGNVFLASLAVADVGVSTLAMTFYGLQLLQGRWILGPFMCRLWFSCDVLFSTASIMHLACIALDRYLSIVRPFEHERTASERRRYGMMFACWFGSALLSFIPIFTGIYTTREQRQKIDCLSHVRGRCIFAVNQPYAIVSSSFSFWVPGAVMIIIYVMLIRIADKKEREAYRTMGALNARRRISQPTQYFVHRRSSDDQAFIEGNSTANPSQRNHPLTSASTRSTSANGFCANKNNNNNNNQKRKGKHDSIDTQMERHASIDTPGSSTDPRNSQMKHLKRERRAVKTLGAIMLAFLMCWLPFFVRYSACEPNRCSWEYMPIIEDIVFWVGYFNSMINPFLYAFHNRDFRDAFQRTLSKYFGCCRQRRTSTSSSIPLPPATPSGELNRTGSKKQKFKPKTKTKTKTKTKSKTKNRSKSFDAHETERLEPSKVIGANNGLEISNGNTNNGETNLDSKRNSFV